MEPPELPLSDEERAAVYEFEASISSHEIKKGVSIETMIAAQKGEDVYAPLFFAEAFLDGSIDLAPFGNPELRSHKDVYQWLAQTVKEGAITSDMLRSVSRQSTLAYKNKIANALLTSQEVPDTALESMSLVITPESVVEQTESTDRARQFLLELRKQYKEEVSSMDGAKRAVVEVYLARVNEMAAKNIPAIDYLMHQSLMIDDQEGFEEARSVLSPSIRSILDSGEKKQQLFRRLDYLRNGLGIDEEGDSTSVSGKVWDIEEASHTTGEQESIFTPEQTEALRKTRLDPDEMVGIFSRIIAKADLLSEEDSSTWSPKRRVRARDNLFQVVKNPSKATFEVDGISGVYKVASEPRSIYEALVVGGFHELRHIDQAQADRTLGETLRIATVKGKRPSMIREGGANMKQREAEQRYFGKGKPFALTYARALKALESGGSLFEATRAFYDEKRRVMPEVAPIDAAKEAADRVLRLIRQGGQSSQAMAYAEEGILSQELAGASPALTERAMAVTGLDLVDQVRLHKYGLLPEIPKSGVDWSDIVMDEFEPYIQKALQAT